jgi:hypothetical protein
MRLILAAALAGLSLAAYTNLSETGEDAGSIADAAVIAHAKVERFSLYVNGRPSGCELSRSAEDDSLAIDRACEGASSLVADAALWIDRPDGSVALAAADGEPLVELAVSDGAAYESFSPATPLILLAPMH